MREFLVTILVFSILALFVQGSIVFRNLKTRLHSFLFLNCVVMIVNNTGYLMQILSRTEEACIASIQFSYLGRIWITYSLVMFTAELCHIRIPMAVSILLAAINAAIYAVILTMPVHHLYYSSTTFTRDSGYLLFQHENGVLHMFFMQLQVLYIAVTLFWIIRALWRTKGKNAANRLRIIIAGFVIESIFFLIQIYHVLDITNYYDVSFLGHFALTVSMSVAIFRYNLLGIIDLAKDYIIDKLSEGVIAVDQDGRVRYFNEHATRIYPDLTLHPGTVVDEVKRAIASGETIRRGALYYTPEVKELQDDEEQLGKLYALVDTTVAKQNEIQLKSEAAMVEMAANRMKERLMAAEELVQQDKAMRHDRRHFEALLLSLLQDGKVDEVRRYLEERLSQEPRSSKRYCENATVNAALTHYIAIAERQEIPVNVQANIPAEPGVEEMKLAIVISNLLENAIHACEELPAAERNIEVKVKYKEQLLLEVTNSCKGRVPLDEDGHPYATADGHGIGTRSVLAFVRETGSEIRYIAENGKFRVRMIIG